MSSMTQSPSRDPIQTLQPQFSSDFSSWRPTNRFSYGRIHSETRLRVENKLHCSLNKKRSHTEAWGDLSKHSGDLNPTYKRDQGAIRRSTVITGYETTKAAKIFGEFAEKQLEQEQAKRMMRADVKSNSANTSPMNGFQKQDPTIDSSPDIDDEAPRKLARLNSKSLIEPCVDEFSRHLGVGWSKLPESDPDLQAAARGWARFIEKHFSITNVEVRLWSKGLACYLVQATEGFYLFGDDLKQGRLVGHDLETALTNIKGPVPIFKGELLENNLSDDVKPGIAHSDPAGSQLDTKMDLA
ncbi:hypothetical protein GcM3_134004 [Golovinomyces cichoracearum]|uniref:Uncharacterized protein n=1 Tax=Golovinomyces cichoracearum TaxID=62708 RepID=A0A420I357_9PEZI|nr:hypothetical protein GcM3_134004 [Golovinomyces cichoracearum]